MNSIPKIPTPVNEPVLSYAPGTPERADLKRTLKELSGRQLEIPLVIGGKDVHTGKTVDVVMPHCHRHVLAKAHQAGPAELQAAIAAAREAWRDWSAWGFEQRAAVFLKAADLLATRYRPIVNGATMLGQSKTAHQAEIDAACELIDFFRFNVQYAERVYAEQPLSVSGVWNYLDYRPLEGFVYAITPFNFTSIGGNLPTAPAILGNTVVWKPASSALYSAHFIMEILEAAGLPPGVINMVPGAGAEVGDPVLASPALAGIHFTGSTATFQGMWETVGRNIRRYRSYPRIVGETGGKDFVFAHASADVPSLVTALTRGAFEYQGQKCSAASRAFVPASLWAEVRDRLLRQVAEIRVGDPTDFTNFMGAVIDANAFSTIKGYVDFARQSPDAEILAGGGYDDGKGYFVEPTVVLAKRPGLKLLREEIFGPVLTVWVYEDRDLDTALEICDSGSPYALTGAVFARDRAAVVRIADALTHAAGNFYVNDKPTGAVVGQQPFGGARASGTNDKAGSVLN